MLLSRSPMSCVLLNPMTNSQSVFPVSFAGSTWGGALACSSDVKGDRVSPTSYSLLLPSLVCQLLVSIEHCGCRCPWGCAQSTPLSNQLPWSQGCKWHPRVDGSHTSENSDLLNSHFTHLTASSAIPHGCLINSANSPKIQCLTCRSKPNPFCGVPVLS